MGLNAIDISSWQAGLKVARMASTEAVIVKATESTDYFNQYFDQWAADTVRSGRKLGCYHFARPGDAVRQADFFLSKVKKYWGKAIMFLDWEENAVPLGPSWAKTWCDRVHAKTGTRPIIYMSKSVCNAYDWSACVDAGYALWVAQYPDYSQTGFRKESQIWTDSSPFGAWKSTWTLFQYTSCGRVAGYDGDLDLDYFRYGRDTWDEFASGSRVRQAVSRVTTTAPRQSKPEVQIMVDEAVRICKDDSHGYTQDMEGRWGPDYDCASFVFHCVDRAGYGVSMVDPRWTGSLAERLCACGFTKLRFDRSALRYGDVLLSHSSSRQHTEIYIGDGRTAGAHIAETGGAYGRTGDQTGSEISVQDLCWTPEWILRPPDSGEKEPAPSGVKYVLQRKCDVRTRRSVYSGKAVGSLKKYATVYLKGVRTNARGNTWGYIASGKYKGRYIAVKFDGATVCAKAGTRTVDQLAREVIAGHWGNGAARVDALRKKGYDADAVQRRVNELM